MHAAAFIWKKRSGAEGERLACQLMSVFIAPECRQSTSDREFVGCLHVSNELKTALQRLSKMHTFILTPYRFIFAHYSFVGSGFLKNCTTLHSLLTYRRDRGAASGAILLDVGVNKPQGSGSGHAIGAGWN